MLTLTNRLLVWLLSMVSHFLFSFLLALEICRKLKHELKSDTKLTNKEKLVQYIKQQQNNCMDSCSTFEHKNSPSNTKGKNEIRKWYEIPPVDSLAFRQVFYGLYFFLFLNVIVLITIELNSRNSSLTTNERIVGSKNKLTTWGLYSNFYYYLSQFAYTFLSQCVVKNSETSKFWQTFSKLTESTWSTLIFPQSFVISSFYWVMYISVGGAVKSLNVRHVLPPFLDHSVHTLPIVVNLIEGILFKFNHLPFKKMVLVQYIYGSTYWGFTILLFLNYGLWPYGKISESVWENKYYKVPFAIILGCSVGNVTGWMAKNINLWIHASSDKRKKVVKKSDFHVKKLK